MAAIIEWLQANWVETGLIGTWVGLFARIIWKFAGVWFAPVKRWFQSRGSTTALGVTKHRDQDDDAFLRVKLFGRSVELFASGKYVDTSHPNAPKSDDEEVELRWDLLDGDVNFHAHTEPHKIPAPEERPRDPDVAEEENHEPQDETPQREDSDSDRSAR